METTQTPPETTQTHPDGKVAPREFVLQSERSGHRPAKRLTPREKAFIVKSFAGYARPVDVQRSLEENYGRILEPESLLHYRDTPYWSKEIQRVRAELDKMLDEIPICSMYWRMMERQRLIEESKRRKGELSVARGLLMDAAMELGQVKGKSGSGPVNVQVNLLTHVESLPPDQALAYAQTGELPAKSWSQEAMGGRTVRAALEIPAPVHSGISGESESIKTKVRKEPKRKHKKRKKISCKRPIKKVMSTPPRESDTDKLKRLHREKREARQSSSTSPD